MELLFFQKKQLLLGAGLVLVFVSVSAQYDTTYFQTDGTLAVVKTECDYYSVRPRFVRNVDSIVSRYCSGQQIRSVQYLDGKGLSHGRFRSFHRNGLVAQSGNYDKGWPTGEFTGWYVDGRLRSVEQYDGNSTEPVKIIQYWDSLGLHLITDGKGECRCVLGLPPYSQSWERGAVDDGRREGMWKGETLDGKVRFEEEYDTGALISGVSWSGGMKYRYVKKEEAAAAPGGNQNFYAAVYRSIRYPDIARESDVQGTVYVQFIMEKDGTLNNIEVIRGIGAGCDQEALNAVRKSAYEKWTPAYSRGQPVRTRLILPVACRLE